MERLSIAKLSRPGYRAVIEVDDYVGTALDTVTRNLVFLRASVVNGCTYCVDAHSTELLEAGVPARKVFAVAAWTHSGFFTERERLVLELTDAVTRLGQEGLADELYARVLAAFSEKEASDLLLAIALINLWNRVAIPTLMQPEQPLEG